MNTLCVFLSAVTKDDMIWLFAIYYRENMAIIESLSTPLGDSEDLNFPTRYAQPLHKQFIACLWKQHWSYWRNSQYTAVRFFFTISISLLFGSICWGLGSQRFYERHSLLHVMVQDFSTFWTTDNIWLNDLQKRAAGFVESSGIDVCICPIYWSNK